jgi:hypothetical protein
MYSYPCFKSIHKIKGVYMLENSPPMGGGGSADVILRKKYEMGKRMGENV